MRLVRFRIGGRETHGILEEGNVVRELESGPFSELRPGKNVIPLSEVLLLAPVRPGKIIALGLNYRMHAAELDMEIPKEPVLFMKPPSSVIGPEEVIKIPQGVGRVDHEAELALIVGRKSRNLTNDNALDALLGITCFNDVTARDLQRKDGQWTRSKSFDTFAPMGPFIETDFMGDERTVECLVNDVSRQKGSTGDFIFDLKSILVFISGIMTLEPGDCIATGTPPGVGPLNPGDRVEVRIEGVGSLKNIVAPAGIT